MDDELQKIIMDHFSKLPENVQTALVSAEFKEKIRTITKRQHLLIDQAGALETEIMLVLIGLSPLNEFVSQLQKNVNLPIFRAREVAMDVSENIFKPIRESLQLINSQIEADAPSKKLQDKEDDALDRDQVLKEIENPKIISQSVAVPKKMEVETLSEVKYQQDFKPAAPSTVETKMSGITITHQTVVNEPSKPKLPQIEKNKPASGIDPYREPFL